ncbi:MAG: cobyric acid synthase, partial [Acidimicrobiales bacterium]
AGPGAGHRVAGYRIHHGRVDGADGAVPWLVSDTGEPFGWHAGRVCGTTLHGLFEDDGFRSSVLGWAADRAGKRWMPGEVRFADARLTRLDRIADAIEVHVDLDRLTAIIEEGSP